MFDAIAASAPTANPRRGPESDARGRDDHRDGLHARDRREEDTAGGGDAAERRDEREVAGRVAPLLEPREAAGDERERREQRRETAVRRVEHRPQHAGEPERDERYERDPRPQREPPPARRAGPAGARGAAGRAWRRGRPARLAASLEQPRGERGLAIGVDPARRLVEHEQVRLGDGDGGDPEPLALAAREVARMTAPPRTSSPNRARAAAARSSSPPTPSATSSIAVSRRDSGPGSCERYVARPVSRDRPPRRLEQPCGDLRERRLAAAVAPFEGDDLAAMNGQRPAAEELWAVAVGERDGVEPHERTTPGERRGGRIVRLRPARVPRPPDREPGARLRHRGVEHDPSFLHHDHAIRDRERPVDALLGEDGGAPRPLDRAEERRRAGRVELRGRLVEQEQLRARARAPMRGRPAAAHRRRARPCVASARCGAPTVGERRLDARPDQRAGSSAEVLEAERHLVLDPRHHDLVLGVLEDDGDGAGERGGAVRAACRARRPRRGPRSGRRGSAGRALRGLAAASTCRCRTARAARRSRPPGARARRPVTAGAPPG